MSINVNEYFENGFRVKRIQAKSLNLYLYYTYYIDLRYKWNDDRFSLSHIIIPPYKSENAHFRS